jgi:enoyl-CoA hydratase/carnithine racemase
MGAASYESILFEQSEGVATITLNRPDKLNAYTPEMGNEVVAAFRAAREDDAVRVVVLTGAGRGFCAGVDLDRLKQMHAEAARGAESSGPKLGEEEFVRSFPEEIGRAHV